jgi:hypothetical protein
MKPTVFEIHRNGETFNETSHAREFQKMLEQNILKLNSIRSWYWVHPPSCLSCNWQLHNVERLLRTCWISTSFPR